MTDGDPATEALLEFLNACEAGIGAAKQRIKEMKGIAEEQKPSWNPDTIKWTETQGSSGLYERSEDVNSLDFKEMLRNLAGHSGKLSRDGFFYWAFQNGSTVGRRRKQA